MVQAATTAPPVALAGSGATEALDRLREKYPTGSLCVLAVPDGPWNGLAPGGAELLEFTRPRDLPLAD